MNLHWSGNTLWITRLTVGAMGRLVGCVPQGPQETETLAALLAGVRVCVLREGLEYRKYRKTAPLGMYRRLVSLERKMREMGVVVVRNSGGKPLGYKEIGAVGGTDLPDGAVKRQ